MGEHHALVLNEGVLAEARTSSTDVDVPRRRYKVAKDLVKRGKLWSVGEYIELDAATAGRFMALGEVTEEHDKETP